MKTMVLVLMVLGLNVAQANDVGLYAFDVQAPNACEAIDGETLAEGGFNCMEIPDGQSLAGAQSFCTNNQTILFVFHSSADCEAGLQQFKSGNH